MKTDISPVSVDLYFIPVETRIPLKFGPETLTPIKCACVHEAQGRMMTDRPRMRKIELGPQSRGDACGRMTSQRSYWFACVPVGKLKGAENKNR